MGMERRGRVAPCTSGRREGVGGSALLRTPSRPRWPVRASERVALWRMHTGTTAAHQPRRR
eukprot:5490554-Prymnesium_polylepis.1